MSVKLTIKSSDKPCTMLAVGDLKAFIDNKQKALVRFENPALMIPRTAERYVNLFEFVDREAAIAEATRIAAFGSQIYDTPHTGNGFILTSMGYVQIVSVWTGPDHPRVTDEEIDGIANAIEAMLGTDRAGMESRKA